MTNKIKVPSVSVTYAQTGTATKSNELGMRPMQERAYAKRGEQYLLIKSPPASGKSRALMFIALDKIHNQGLKKAIITVPEKAIGASFNDEPLTKFGFTHDWHIKPKWNLCNAPGAERSKVAAMEAFLKSDDQFLVCPHPTFRNAFESFRVEAFDNCLIAVDEFHHVSANPNNKLGTQVAQLIERDKAHIVAMTGSYFRGDAEPVLAPSDEAKFDSVTYTYYEQLNGYNWLKTLDIGYFFYSGPYTQEILNVLNPKEKTIVHIPSVNSRESTKDKIKEVDHIIDELGDWQGTDPDTGFQLVKTSSGKVLRIADLVNDEPSKREKVSRALKDPTQKNNRDHVDVIIALGMAKEGFDWIWCEHALTVGYRSSLTEIVQIIGRATRDAKDKTHAKFTNLIAEPDASEDIVREAVNDTLKAIAASLLMEQVLAPKFNFLAKKPNNRPIPGVDYGEDGYKPGKNNVGLDETKGEVVVEMGRFKEFKSKKAEDAYRYGLNEIIARMLSDSYILEQGLFNREAVPQEITQVRVAKIIQELHPDLDEEDAEALRQRAVAAFFLVQNGKSKPKPEETNENTSLIDGVRKLFGDVRELDIDLIDSINPFGEAYNILAKSMTEKRLMQIATIIEAKKVKLDHEEARDLAKRAIIFKNERGRTPSILSADPWERKMAEGVAYLKRLREKHTDG